VGNAGDQRCGEARETTAVLPGAAEALARTPSGIPLLPPSDIGEALARTPSDIFFGTPPGIMVGAALVPGMGVAAALAGTPSDIVGVTVVPPAGITTAPLAVVVVFDPGMESPPENASAAGLENPSSVVAETEKASTS